jgi:hypothetical protein
VFWSGTLLAQHETHQRRDPARSEFPPQVQQIKKLSDVQKREIQESVKMIDSAATAQAAPNDLSLAWVREYVLKALGNRQYVPFTVSIDPSKLSGGNATIYWRVVAKTAAAPAAAAPANTRSAQHDRKAPGKPEYAFEDLGSVSVPSEQGPFAISRSFTVGPGSYDVWVVVKEPTPQRPQRNAPPPKTSLIRQTVDVPDLWDGELNASTVFVTQRIDPLPAPLTPLQQVERPYALGTMEIVPVVEAKFTKKADLSTLVMIYNVKTDAANKPDVSVEYNFYTKEAGGEQFFNKTNPQSLNAQTLPPQFDFAAGHQLQSGHAVPLASFPEGDYRLEIKIADKLAAKSLTSNVNFTVVGW